MGDLIDHPRRPPPEPSAAPQPSEATIRRRAWAMREYFDGLISEYPSAVMGGRLDSWRSAAHAYIDLVTDAQEKSP